MSQGASSCLRQGIALNPACKQKSDFHPWIVIVGGRGELFWKPETAQFLPYFLQMFPHGENPPLVKHFLDHGGVETVFFK